MNVVRQERAQQVYDALDQPRTVRELHHATGIHVVDVAIALKDLQVEGKVNVFAVDDTYPFYLWARKEALPSDG